MRVHHEPRPGFTRRMAAALVGVWLGVSCLFCCGDVTNAHAARTSDEGHAATRAAAIEDDCCRAHLQHRGEARGGTVESDPRDTASPARVGRRASGGEPCVHCSRQVADSARRTRVRPAPADASDCRRTHRLPGLAADASRGGQTLLLNRGGTRVRLCVLRI